MSNPHAPPTAPEGFMDDVWGHHGYGCAFPIYWTSDGSLVFGPAVCLGGCLDNHADHGCFHCSKRYPMVIP